MEPMGETDKSRTLGGVMKKVIVICLLLFLAANVYGWDYFAFVYGDVDTGTEHAIDGTVVWVAPLNNMWVAYVNTCADRDGYYATGPIGLLFDDRPVGWNPGTRISVTAVFNATWDREGDALPTFREVKQ